MKDIIDLAEHLHSNPQLGWTDIVATAGWIDPKTRQGVAWRDAEATFRARFDQSQREEIGWNESEECDAIKIVGWLGYIAKIERSLNKPIVALHTVEEFKAALDGCSNDAPDLLFAFWRKGRLDREGLRSVLLDVWRYTNHVAYWPARTWRKLFQIPGFLSDGPAKPKRPITVYRGCTPKGRRGFSWTLNRDRAERFGDYWLEHAYSTEPGHVYKALAKPRDILAMIDGSRDYTMPDGTTFRVGGEDEVIIDARRMPIALVETAEQRLVRIAQEMGDLGENLKQWLIAKQKRKRLKDE